MSEPTISQVLVSMSESLLLLPRQACLQVGGTLTGQAHKAHSRRPGGQGENTSNPKHPTTQPALQASREVTLSLAFPLPWPGRLWERRLGQV